MSAVVAYIVLKNIYEAKKDVVRLFWVGLFRVSFSLTLH